jgi:hypothetical protein
MEYRFTAEEWKKLTRAERIGRCRLWAHEASELAMVASPVMKRAYLDIAHHWEQLAKEIEAETDPGK